jgi:phage gp36-like protein
MLTKVADGDLTLGLSADNQEPPIAETEEKVLGPDRVFSRKKLKGY